MIVTAFPFFNELDLLDVRLHELRGVVDLHVLVESPTTWSGAPKPLHFAENRARFAEFNVFPVTVELPAAANSPWDREWVAHKALNEAVRALNPEIAIWTDADEIPRAETVDRFRRMGVEAAHVDMDFLIFFLDRMDPTQRAQQGGGTTAKIHKYDRHAPWHPWRGEFHHPWIPESGWHMEYQGGRDHLLAKLAAFSHGDEPGGRAMRLGVEAGALPGLERSVPYPFESLPRHVRENRDRFSRYFSNP